MQPPRRSQGLFPWIGTVIRLVTGGVWVVAGAIKLPDPYESISAVRAYEILPEAVVPFVGHLLPVLEVAVGLLLISGLLTRSAGLASAVLFAIFVAGIASVWIRGIEIDCGCFGGGGAEEGASSQYPLDIARDLALMFASLWLVWRPRTRLALDNVLFHTDERELERNHDGAEEHAGQPS